MRRYFGEKVRDLFFFQQRTSVQAVSPSIFTGVPAPKYLLGFADAAGVRVKFIGGKILGRNQWEPSRNSVARSSRREENRPSS